METLKLGKTNLFVTDIAFGAWAIGGSHWGPVDDETSLAAMKTAIETGCSLIDTAPAYGQGHSEVLVGKVLKDAPHTVKVATKCGLVWDDQGKFRIDNSPASIRKEVRASLDRLGVDTIDLYQVHWPDKRVPLEDTLGEMESLKKEGLIRYWGVCNYEGEALKKCFEMGADTIQSPFNLIDRRVEETVLPLALEAEAGILAYGPLCRGLLTGKYKTPPTFPEGDIRLTDDNFKEERFNKIVSLNSKLEVFAKELGKNLSQMALAWVLSRPHSLVALAGARTSLQIQDNLRGSGFKLSVAMLQDIESLVKNYFPEAFIK